MIPGLPSPWLLLGAVLSFIGVAAFSAYITHGFDNSRYEALRLSYADATAKAAQQAADRQRDIDKITLDAAVSAAKSQAQIVTQTQTITKEVVRYVQNVVSCPDDGLLRVYNDAVRGAAATEVSNSAGQSDGGSRAAPALAHP